MPDDNRKKPDIGIYHPPFGKYSANSNDSKNNASSNNNGTFLKFIHCRHKLISLFSHSDFSLIFRFKK